MGAMHSASGRAGRRAGTFLLACLSAAWCGCGGKGGQRKGARAGSRPAPGKPLLCYVGGTMRPVMEQLARAYEKQTRRKVEIDHAGSGELLTRIVTQKRGDLYVCHDPFQDRLARRGMSAEGWTLAVVTPTIAVRKGNPKGIRSVRDLAKPGMKLAMTDSQKSTTGWIIPRIFDKAGVREAIEKNIGPRAGGGGEAADRVAIGDVDAANVWDAVILAPDRRDKLDAVPIDPPYRAIPGVDAVTSPTGRTYDIGRIKVTMDLLTCSKQPDAARAFAEFVVANQAVFVRDFGFSPTPPDLKGQSLFIHCGAGIRHAMEDAAATFERQTGATLRVSYAGSGTLITTIKLKRQGDLYMPGDQWYLDQLEKGPDKLVEDRKLVACFVPVIVVRKGNPKGIRRLGDLLKPGVKLGLGNPEACQIGRLCEQIFVKNKMNPAAVRDRTAFSSPTVHEIGVKVQTRAIDAGIVWDAVAANFARDVDVVKIPAAQNLISRVAIGRLACAKNKRLARQFMEFLASAQGKAIFARHHYTVEEPK